MSNSENTKARYQDTIIENSKVLFILESPHNDEVKLNSWKAAIGPTGKKLNESLYKDSSIGISDNADYIYSIINTFTFPIQVFTNQNCHLSKEEIIRINKETSEKLSNFEENFKTDIKVITDSYTNYKNYMDYKNTLKKLYQKYPAIRTCYKNRMDNLIMNNTRIIVCGIIAQSFFEDIYNMGNIWGEPKIIPNLGNKVIALYHPSHSKWKEKSNQTKLTNFLK